MTTMLVLAPINLNALPLEKNIFPVQLTPFYPYNTLTTLIKL